MLRSQSAKCLEPLSYGATNLTCSLKCINESPPQGIEHLIHISELHSKRMERTRELHHIFAHRPRCGRNAYTVNHDRSR